MSRGLVTFYIVDTFAWLEYFLGSEAGRKTKEYIEGDQAVTPTIVLAEFADKYAREKLDPTERLRYIKNRSVIAVLDEQTAEVAGRINAERRAKVAGWGLADSVILATARMRKLRVITGDEHFRDLQNEALMIK